MRKLNIIWSFLLLYFFGYVQASIACTPRYYPEFKHGTLELGMTKAQIKIKDFNNCARDVSEDIQCIFRDNAGYVYAYDVGEDFIFQKSIYANSKNMPFNIKFGDSADVVFKKLLVLQPIIDYYYDNNSSDNLYITTGNCLLTNDGREIYQIEFIFDKDGLIYKISESVQWP